MDAPSTRSIVLAMTGFLVALVIGVAAQEAPTVSEATTLQWEIAALKQQLALAQATNQVCQGQLAPQTYKAAMDAIAADVAALRQTFEAAHPGWTLDDRGQPATKGE